VDDGLLATPLAGKGPDERLRRREPKGGPAGADAETLPYFDAVGVDQARDRAGVIVDPGVGLIARPRNRGLRRLGWVPKWGFGWAPTPSRSSWRSCTGASWTVPGAKVADVTTTTPPPRRRLSTICIEKAYQYPNDP
jgi:hypothetical protein